MTNRRRVLILFVHPALQKSRVNEVLIGAVRDLDGVTFHDLYEAYPDFAIDVDREQRLLEAHDVVVFQHPFYWYSAPALLKEWLDLVLEHGWAYGKGGGALRGKLLVSAVTTGAREEAYQHGGYNRYTMAELLAPFDQTAHLCGMDYLPPHVVHGTHELDGEAIARHATGYGQLMVGLRDRRLDLDRARPLPRLNSDIDAILARRAE